MRVYRGTIECVDCIFFFNDTATTEIYTLSLHDALPISEHLVDALVHVLALALLPGRLAVQVEAALVLAPLPVVGDQLGQRDRKSTRLNSSHANISYAVFCLKKKTLTHSAFSSIYSLSSI